MKYEGRITENGTKLFFFLSQCSVSYIEDEIYWIPSSSLNLNKTTWKICFCVI